METDFLMDKWELPVEWKTAVIFPNHMRGGRRDCNNYRKIALLNVTYNVFLNCILSRSKCKA